MPAAQYYSAILLYAVLVYFKLFASRSKLVEVVVYSPLLVLNLAVVYICALGVIQLYSQNKQHGLH